jgi:hypothetical protein
MFNREQESIDRPSGSAWCKPGLACAELALAKPLLALLAPQSLCPCATILHRTQEARGGVWWGKGLPGRHSR